MKKLLAYFFLATMTLGLVASCKDDDDLGNPPTKQEIEKFISGKWRLAEKNKDLCPSNECDILTFGKDGRSTNSYAADSYGKSGGLWFNKMESKYSINNNVLSMYDFVGGPEADARITHNIRKITANEMITDFVEVSEGGHVSHPNERRKYVKVNVDYADAIVGMWEGTGHTGFETEGNYYHRWEYKADGTYVYYDKVGDKFVEHAADSVCKYIVDGDWLATYWLSKTNQAKQEWWTLKRVDANVMEWENYRIQGSESALQTFTFKRIK